MATITLRTNADTEQALAELTSEGVTRSEAIRQAVLVAAEVRRRAKVRAEAESLRDDSVDRAEVRKVQADMERLRAW
ncbi:MAG: hypothetical protein ACYCZM_00895 [Acidimicrobiales bacterium]